MIQMRIDELADKETIQNGEKQRYLVRKGLTTDNNAH